MNLIDSCYNHQFHVTCLFYVFVLCDYHQYHGVLVRWRCSCGDTFTCNCPILVLNKVYYYYYYYVRNLLHQYIYNSYIYIYMSEISYINISTTPTFISTCQKSPTSIYLQLLLLYLHVRNLLHQYIYNSYFYIYMHNITQQHLNLYIYIYTFPLFPISMSIYPISYIYVTISYHYVCNNLYIFPTSHVMCL